MMKLCYDNKSIGDDECWGQSNHHGLDQQFPHSRAFRESRRFMPYGQFSFSVPLEQSSHSLSYSLVSEQNFFGPPMPTIPQKETPRYVSDDLGSQFMLGGRSLLQIQYEQSKHQTVCQQPSSIRDHTDDLNYYFEKEVKLHIEERKRAVEVMLRAVRKILNKIHAMDPRFKSEPIFVGSYWSGLKVGQPDEFDISVPLNATPLTLAWIPYVDACYLKVSGDGTLLRTNMPVPSPPTGYNRVKYFPSNPLWINPRLPKLIVNSHLIPALVKITFKRYLVQAVRLLNFEQERVSVDLNESGPALTVNITYIDFQRGARQINVDFTPVFLARTSFPPWLGWPRKTWPGREKVEKIKQIGINDVPKGEIDWYLSFAECVKELTKDMDKYGENTNRKKLHRIMKRLTHDVWCPGPKPVVSSYMLKNLLFWECEDFPNPRDWGNDVLWKRFYSLINHLLRALSRRRLLLYFHPQVNLLMGKEGAELDAVMQNIRRFLENPTRYLRRE